MTVLSDSDELADQRCVVLGGGGFIGTNLCHALATAGAKTVSIDIRQPACVKTGIEWHQLGLNDISGLDNVLQANDLVIHLVSSTVPGSAVGAFEDATENLLPTLRLLDLCVRKRSRRIIFLSSGGAVYGSEAPVPTAEGAPKNPISWYGVQKLAIEKYLAVYRRQEGLDSFALRVSNPFGPYQTNPAQGLVASVIRHALAGTPVNVFGDGSVQRDYIYIDDVILAIRMAASAARNDSMPRTYNIGTGTGRSINDVIAAVEKAHGAPISVSRLPARGVDVPVSILDVSLAKKHLNWEPRFEWQQAVSLAYQWARNTAR